MIGFKSGRGLAAPVAGAVLLLAGCCGVVGTKQDAEAPCRAGCGKSPEMMQAPAAAGTGMKAHIDPATGELTDKPVAGTDAGPGDVIVPSGPVRDSPVPGGGVMVGPGEEADQ